MATTDHLPDDGGSNGLWKKFKKDKNFRRRIVHTSCFCWSFISLGWGYAILGPTFPDIRLIIDKDLETASLFFTAGSLGLILGAILGGTLYDRGHRFLVLVMSTVGMAVTTAAIPWCSNFALLLVVRVLWGTFCGGQDTGANAEIFQVWKDEIGPYFQALHFSFSLGSLIAPFTTAPFLTERVCLVPPSSPPPPGFRNRTAGTTPTTSRITDVPYYGDMYSSTVWDDSFSIDNSTECVESYGEIRVYYAYLLAAVIMLSAFAFYVVLFCLGRVWRPYYLQTTSDGKGAKVNRIDLTLRLRCVFLFLVAMLLMCYVIIEQAFSDFMATFCLSYLNWDATKASFITGVFWVSLGIGRFCGIFIVRWVTHTVLLFSTSSLVLCSLIGILIGALASLEWLVWLATAVVGLAMSVIFPCILNWTSESILDVNGKVFSVVYTAASLGSMLTPILFGFLMDRYSQMWFIYLLSLVAALQIIVFLATFLLSRVLLRSSSRQRSQYSRLD